MEAARGPGRPPRFYARGRRGGRARARARGAPEADARAVSCTSRPRAPVLAADRRRFVVGVERKLLLSEHVGHEVHLPAVAAALRVPRGAVHHVREARGWRAAAAARAAAARAAVVAGAQLGVRARRAPFAARRMRSSGPSARRRVAGRGGGRATQPTASGSSAEQTKIARISLRIGPFPHNTDGFVPGSNETSALAAAARADAPRG